MLATQTGLLPFSYEHHPDSMVPLKGPLLQFWTLGIIVSPVNWATNVDLQGKESNVSRVETHGREIGVIFRK